MEDTQNTILQEGLENTNAKDTENEKDTLELESSEIQDSFLPFPPRLSTDPSYTQEEVVMITTLKEARNSKNEQISLLRQEYAKQKQSEQPNTSILQEIVLQIEGLKQELDEIDATLFAMKEKAFHKSDSFKPLKSILTPFKKPMITEAELIDELGANEIRDLSDLHGEGIWNRSVIDDCIKDAESLIASFFKLPSNPTPFLKDICTKLAIIELKRRNSYPKEELDSIKQECLDWLNKMASGKIPTNLDEEVLGITRKNRCFVHKKSKINLKRLYD